MSKNNNKTAMVFAILAAVFYAINVPFSKQLMTKVSPTCMAAFLYWGAGLGIGIIYCFSYRKEGGSERLSKSDLPYTIAMIVLDILAPIFLMFGVNYGTAASASLLGNFEIVVTTLVALAIFREKVSGRLWSAVAFITVSSIILSFEGTGSFSFSLGSLFVILATCCWGFENNCTRKISDKSTYQIVLLKGIFSGSGSLVVAFIVGEKMPEIKYAAFAMLLGFIAYGLSIFLYVRAQRIIGAAKTSAFYAVAPFVGGGLSFVVNGEKLTISFAVAFVIMVIGTVFLVKDTLNNSEM